jgi:regulator of replication initiation timing
MQDFSSRIDQIERKIKLLVKKIELLKKENMELVEENIRLKEKSDKESEDLDIAFEQVPININGEEGGTQKINEEIDRYVEQIDECLTIIKTL